MLGTCNKVALPRLEPSRHFTLADAQNEMKRRAIREFGDGLTYTIISTRKMLYDGDANTLQLAYAFELAISAPIGKDRAGMYR